MLIGSVIMDVMNVEQAKIAEEAGACAVMALGEHRATAHYEPVTNPTERIPADIRRDGGVARMVSLDDILRTTPETAS
jgi:pyridoxal 5'-phosphate synthase pdxS subunit